MPSPFASFDPEIPLATTQVELDELFRRFPLYDPYYVRCAAEQETRAQLTAWWTQFAPFADRDFRRQYRLPLNFHARAWEMYLGVLLLQHGHVLRKTTASRPDLHVITPIECWIEAIAPSQGVGANHVPDEIDPIEEIVVRTFPEDELLLRFCTAMSAKRSQNQHRRERGVIAGDVPSVVAVNMGGFNQLDLDPPVAARAAFGFGHLAIPLGHAGAEPYHVGRAAVNNANGQPVPLGLFRSEEYTSLSAIILCREDALNALRHPGQDLHVVHNPLAEVPITDDLFGFATQWRLEDGDTVRRINPR